MGELPAIKNKKEKRLLVELSALIEHSRQQAAMQVNSVLILLFWQLGTRINHYILQHKRTVYGKQIVVTLSRQLSEC